jgi:hypothetical protein
MLSISEYVSLAIMNVILILVPLRFMLRNIWIRKRYWSVSERD